MAETLAHLMGYQLRQLAQLASLLNEESGALATRDLTSMERLMRDKLSLLTQIRSTDQRLEAHPEREHLTTLPALAAQLREAKTLMAQCQAHNAQNQTQAELASASLGRLQQLLQRSRHATAMTYTGEGQTHVGQRLGKKITV